MTCSFCNVNEGRRFAFHDWFLDKITDYVVCTQCEHLLPPHKDFIESRLPDLVDLGIKRINPRTGKDL
jgi:hypothetical protein